MFLCRKVSREGFSVSRPWPVTGLKCLGSYFECLGNKVILETETCEQPLPKLKNIPIMGCVPDFMTTEPLYFVSN